MRIYLIYGDVDGEFAERLTERLIAGKHMVVQTLQDADVTLGLLSPDSVASLQVCEAWEGALNAGRPLLFVLVRPCSVPPRFARISFIDFSTNEDSGYSRLEGILKALSKPNRDVKTATMELRKVVDVNVAGNVSGTLNVAGGDIIIDRREIYLGGAPSEAQRMDQRNREIILEKMRTFWIKGVLEKSLHGLNEIALGKRDKPHSVDHPWGMLLDTVGVRDSKTLPTGTKTISVFDQAGHALLILGGPGSGKTTVLLELARDSIARAETNPNEPVPIILNLTSWGGCNMTIAEWMVNELTLKYQIPKKIGEPWLQTGQLMLLLDGLDEVAADRREDAVRAINSFREEHGLVPIAVCCRSAEYDALKVKLNLGGAVLIMPLNARQIDSYLEDGGEELAALRAALQQDAQLTEIAQSPLMLSVMTMVYRGASVDTLLQLTSPEDRRKHLFDTYVARMLKRHDESDIAPEKTVKYLTWLAQRMKAQNYNTFLVERLRQDWFPLPSEKQMFRILSILAGALIGSLSLLIFSLIFDPALDQPVQLHAAIFGFFLGGWMFAQGYRRDPWRVGLYAAFTLGAISGLIVLFQYPAANPDGTPWQAGLSADLQREYWANLTLAMIASALQDGTIGGLLIWQAAARAGMPVEALRWSWKGAFKGLLISFAMLTAVAVLLLAAFTIAGSEFGLSEGFSVANVVESLGLAITLGMMPGLIPAWIFGLSGRETGKNATPLESIHQSAKNGALVGIGTGVLLLLSGLVLAGLVAIGATTEDDFFILRFLIFGGFAFSIPTTVLVGMLFGGITVVKHYLMRFMLAQRDYLPYKIVPFLEHAEVLIFLRQVGAGYIFMHRLILDHFASLTGMPESAPVPAPQAEPATVAQ